MGTSVDPRDRGARAAPSLPPSVPLRSGRWPEPEDVLCVRGSLHTLLLLFAFHFFSTDFHALSHESLTGKGFVSFSLAFCESNDALMLPHFSLFFIPYLLKEGIPLYW